MFITVLRKNKTTKISKKWKLSRTNISIVKLMQCIQKRKVTDLEATLEICKQLLRKQQINIKMWFN